jgi:hypothetical protein
MNLQRFGSGEILKSLPPSNDETAFVFKELTFNFQFKQIMVIKFVLSKRSVMISPVDEDEFNFQIISPGVDSWLVIDIGNLVSKNKTS